MRSGDRPGLQNRRAAGNPVTGGFDPHSLPPFIFNELAKLAISSQTVITFKSAKRDENVIVANLNSAAEELTGWGSHLSYEHCGQRPGHQLRPLCSHRAVGRRWAGFGCSHVPRDEQRSVRWHD